MKDWFACAAALNNVAALRRLVKAAPAVGILLLTLQAPSLSAPPSAPDAALDRQAIEIHRKTLLFDAHVDVPDAATSAHYVSPDGTSRASLDKLERGGFGAVAMAVAVAGPGERTAASYAEARQQAEGKLATILAIPRDHPDQAELARSPDDIERIARAHKIAIIVSFLNARSLGRDIAGIDYFYAKGMRIFGFTHSGHNDWADSSRPTNQPVSEWGGLSPLGKQAIARLNRLGVVVDVSQISDDGVRQAVSLSAAPVIASHSAARGLIDDQRNLSDDLIRLIAGRGGVVQVTAYSNYLVHPDAGYRSRVEAVRKSYGLPPAFKLTFDDVLTLAPQKIQPYLDAVDALRPSATVKDYVDQIDYIARLVGIDHVGIGTDFNHGAGVVGFEDEGDALNVTRELVRRGYTQAQIAKIWSGNFLRVFREVEATSRRLQKSAQTPARPAPSVRKSDVAVHNGDSPRSGLHITS